MTCRELADFIMDYLSGELPDAVRRSFEHHLSICPACVQYLAAYKATVAVGRRAFDDDDGSAAAAGVPEDLIEAILSAARSR